ncbi:MAG: MGMT family protein [Candidatus Edwardsbacteria bacterium]|nr:MGMT family protein [Candidatus Edwardsbacteria bacterium]
MKSSTGKCGQAGGATLAERIKRAIRRIPRGRVASYGQIAALAGHPRAARAVVWVLHSSSGKAKLPWHRVINSRGTISLRPRCGYEEQRARLMAEGVAFDSEGRVDLRRHGWKE